MKLTPQEVKFLNESGRCETCNHLLVLHNTHCCEFCLIPDCPCDWIKDYPTSQEKIEPLVLKEFIEK